MVPKHQIRKRLRGREDGLGTNSGSSLETQMGCGSCIVEQTYVPEPAGHRYIAVLVLQPEALCARMVR